MKKYLDVWRQNEPLRGAYFLLPMILWYADHIFAYVNWNKQYQVVTDDDLILCALYVSVSGVCLAV